MVVHFSNDTLKSQTFLPIDNLTKHVCEGSYTFKLRDKTSGKECDGMLRMVTRQCELAAHI